MAFAITVITREWRQHSELKPNETSKKCFSKKLRTVSKRLKEKAWRLGTKLIGFVVPVFQPFRRVYSKMATELFESRTDVLEVYCVCVFAYMK